MMNRKKSNHEIELDQKIRNRSNIVYLLLLIIITIFVVTKFWNMNIIISDFRFIDLLALLLSLFAIGISIAFYFKATEAGNKFYDDTYKFTKDISETIGRMEERFGERLKHLDEGYNRVLDNGIPFRDKLQDLEKLEKDKQEFEKVISDKEKIIEKLIKESKLSKQEKSYYENKINESNIELNRLKKHINSIEEKTKISSIELKYIQQLLNTEKSSGLMEYVYQYISDGRIDMAKSFIFASIWPDKKTKLYVNMLRHNMLDESGNLEERFINFIISDVISIIN